MTDLPELPRKEQGWRGTLANKQIYSSAVECYAAEVEAWMQERLNSKPELKNLAMTAGEILAFMLVHMPLELEQIVETARRLRNQEHDR